MVLQITTGLRMTAVEFMELPETNQIIELINGVVYVAATPITAHQRATVRFWQLLDSLIPAGEVYIAPTGLYLDDLNYFEPDVMWVNPEGNGAFDDGKSIRGVPDIVVEVLSPSTVYRDRGDKFKAYQHFGVKEYWIADPAGYYLEVFRLNLETRQFERFGIFNRDENFVSTALDQTVTLTSVFDQLPSVDGK